jgi:glyoxylase-like metal-dependent hydrolase (beta-lactamase superfamily II)
MGRWITRRVIHYSTVSFVPAAALSYDSYRMPSTTALDLNWTGRPHSVAAALLEAGGRHAIIDPGPASTLETLRAELSSRGLTVADLEAIFLTHIHLDHAGATGSLVRENPRLRVYVHQRGAFHMADPSLLLASAGRLWADELPRLFGETLPVPEQNLHILEGGETVSLGERKFEVLYTPGHASHHVTYFDPQEGVAFAGDTAGIRIANGPYIMPAAPPPDIDLAIWNQSFDAILNLRPARLFLTHFGFAENPTEHLALFRERLHFWADITEKSLAAQPDTDDAALESFLAQTRAEMSKFLSAADAEQHAFTAGLPLSFRGLARHIRKRATARE